MIWNLIGSIGGKVLDIVDDVVEDKDEANRLKFEIQHPGVSWWHWTRWRHSYLTFWQA